MTTLGEWLRTVFRVMLAGLFFGPFGALAMGGRLFNRRVAAELCLDWGSGGLRSPSASLRTPATLS